MISWAIGLVLAVADGSFGLTDVGTGAVIGGVLGEMAVRAASMFGMQLTIDGWREGMFVGALLSLSYLAFGELGA